ncbi:polysaccharide pyruvyl transferase family protein [Microbacterium lushaniae]|nr:polysaccharide pyruvyl transferase family protein [Microbacterium lushaniae]KAA9159877.1 polysaccharide pyruvyl transferase family protein [Microbacterium lushaniae]
MSMQRIFNYGSSLQAYALRRLIEDAQVDATVSFLDYRPGYPLLPAETEVAVQGGRVRRLVSKVREYSQVETSIRDKARFLNHKRTYAKKYFPLIGIAPERREDVEVDLQIIGSDEVFNCVQSNVNVGYSRDLFGHKSRARRVASYAASFGNTTLEKIESAGISAELAENLADFVAISVRDRNSQRVVETLTGREPAVHLDPTLVYDFTTSGPEIPSERQHDGKYIIVYGYSGRLGPSENAEIRRFADSVGARVLSFGGLQSSADEFIDCDPFTLLAYFRDAAAVITDTFHGTIFSVINEVPFATFIRTSAGNSYGNEEKLGYLLEVLGLRGRALRPGTDLRTLLTEPIDFDAVRSIRALEKQRTQRYLESVLAVA